MAKLNIDFVLLDESVVMHGFRSLMSGAEIDQFKANPVLLLQHNRPREYAGREEMMLPLGKWYDIRVEGDQLLAKPEFDDDDELAMRVQKKVEKGYLNGASVWIDPKTLSEEPEDMLPGQYLPTFTKWGLLEASIVDIPNCNNSLAIRNSAGKRITLSSDAADADLSNYLQQILNKDKNNKMDKKLLCAKLGLPEDATDAQITAKLTATMADSVKLTGLTTENKTLKDEVIALKTAAETKAVETLVDTAVTAKKLNVADREKYIKLAKADFETTKELIDGMPAAESIESKLAGEAPGNKSEIENLCKLSGKELYLNGGLERLQAIAPEQFKEKYKEAFGVDFHTK